MNVLKVCQSETLTEGTVYGFRIWNKSCSLLICRSADFCLRSRGFTITSVLIVLVLAVKTEKEDDMLR